MNFLIFLLGYQKLLLTEVWNSSQWGTIPELSKPSYYKVSLFKFYYNWQYSKIDIIYSCNVVIETKTSSPKNLVVYFLFLFKLFSALTKGNVWTKVNQLGTSEPYKLRTHVPTFNNAALVTSLSISKSNLFLFSELCHAKCISHSVVVVVLFTLSSLLF